MEEIRELVDRLLKRCKENSVPVMVAFSSERTYLAEWGTSLDSTPDRIKRARTAFVSAPSQNKNQMEFD